MTAPGVPSSPQKHDLERAPSSPKGSIYGMSTRNVTSGALVSNPLLTAGEASPTPAVFGGLLPPTMRVAPRIGRVREAAPLSDPSHRGSQLTFLPPGARVRKGRRRRYTVSRTEYAPSGHAAPSPGKTWNKSTRLLDLLYGQSPYRQRIPSALS